jgi:hypothetical protein
MVFLSMDTPPPRLNPPQFFPRECRWLTWRRTALPNSVLVFCQLKASAAGATLLRFLIADV